MNKLLVLLAAPLIALGCDKPAPQTRAPAADPAPAAKTAPAAKADADGLYICTMGAECGKKQVKKGDAIPGCCGDPMVKASTYTCPTCKKTKIISAKADAPKCCGDAPMKKDVP